MVLRKSLVLVAAGVAGGGGTVLLAGRLIASVIYGLAPRAVAGGAAGCTHEQLMKAGERAAERQIEEHERAAEREARERAPE